MWSFPSGSKKFRPHFLSRFRNAKVSILGEIQNSITRERDGSNFSHNCSSLFAGSPRSTKCEIWWELLPLPCRRVHPISLKLLQTDFLVDHTYPFLSIARFFQLYVLPVFLAGLDKKVFMEEFNFWHFIVPSFGKNNLICFSHACLGNCILGLNCFLYLQSFLFKTNIWNLYQSSKIQLTISKQKEKWSF